MADEADLAEGREQMARDDAIRIARTPKPGLKPCFACHYCGEVLRGGELFCLPVDESGDGCARDFDFEQSAKKRNGQRMG